MTHLEFKNELQNLGFTYQISWNCDIENGTQSVVNLTNKEGDQLNLIDAELDYENILAVAKEYTQR